MKIKPLQDRVLLKRQKNDETTPGGIVIPEVARDKQVVKFEVMAVGDGFLDDEGERIPMMVQPGEVVLVQKYAGTEVELDGEKFTIVREDDIQGVIES